MDGFDLPSAIAGSPALISGVAVGALLFVALRLTFAARRIAHDADARTTRAQAEADAADRALDLERERRRTFEDEMSDKVRRLRNEVASLRHQVRQLGGDPDGRREPPPG